IGLLNDSDAQVKFTSAQALRRIGKPAVPELISGLKDEALHSTVSSIIAEIGPDAAEAVPALTKLLNSKDPEAQREAILALAAIGPDAKATAPALLKSLSDSSFPYRPAAAYALGKIGYKEAIPELKKALNTRDNVMLNLASAWSLVQLDPT